MLKYTVFSKNKVFFLRLYLLCNDVFQPRLERFLPFLRTPFCIFYFKLRCICHDLEVEVGRHRKIPLGQRICKSCKTSIETEEHFLLNCQKYTECRFKYNINEQTISQILSSKNYLHYINELYSIRKSIADNI